MTIRELLDTCALEFNEIEIHHKGEVVFTGSPDKMTEVMKGLKVRRWEQYAAEWCYKCRYNLEVFAE